MSNDLFWLRSSASPSSSSYSTPPRGNISAFNPLAATGSGGVGGAGLLSMSSSPLTFVAPPMTSQQQQSQQRRGTPTASSPVSSRANFTFGAATSPQQPMRHSPNQTTPQQQSQNSGSFPRQSPSFQQHRQQQQQQHQHSDPSGVVYSQQRRTVTTYQDDDQDEDEEPRTFVPFRGSAGSYILTSSPDGGRPKQQTASSPTTANSALYNPRSLNLSASPAVPLSKRYSPPGQQNRQQQYHQEGDHHQQQQHSMIQERSDTPPPPPPEPIMTARSPIAMPESALTPPRPPMRTVTQSELERYGFAASTQSAIMSLQKSLHKGHDVLRKSAIETEKVVNEINSEIDQVQAVVDQVQNDLAAFKHKVQELSPMRNPKSQVSLPPPGWKPDAEDYRQASSPSSMSALAASASAAVRRSNPLLSVQ